MSRPSRRIYTAEEQARAYVVLETNQGNIMRTARDCNMPETTIRRWKAEWAENPPEQALVAEVVDEEGGFVENAERVRDKALATLEGKLDKATPSALVATIGMLQDKVSIARGLATSRNETVHALPSPEEIAKTLGAVLAGAIEAAQARDADIIDVELIALPAGEQA